MKDAEQWKICTKIETAVICEKSTDIAITEFRDKYFIVISDNGKIGTLVQVTRETSGLETLFNSKVLFGKDEPEINAVACALTETCNLLKPVVFGFSLKDFSSSTVKDLKQIVEKITKKPTTDSLSPEQLPPPSISLNV